MPHTVLKWHFTRIPTRAREREYAYHQRVTSALARAREREATTNLTPLGPQNSEELCGPSSHMVFETSIPCADRTEAIIDPITARDHERGYRVPHGKVVGVLIPMLPI